MSHLKMNKQEAQAAIVKALQDGMSAAQSIIDRDGVQPGLSKGDKLIFEIGRLVDAYELFGEDE